MSFHLGGGGDGVPEETVARVEVAHHGGHHRACVEAHADVDGARVGVVLVHAHAVRGAHGVQREPGYSQGVVALGLRHASHAHVGVSDGLNLEQLVLRAEHIELCVETVQHVHDLRWGERGRQVRVPDNVTEEDGNVVVRLRINLPELLELGDHSGRNHLMQQCGVAHSVAVPHCGTCVVGNDHLQAMSDLQDGRAPRRVLVPTLLNQFLQILRNVPGHPWPKVLLLDHVDHHRARVHP
mmetsp:Transcript_39244/g.75214  ORF Transcript_39244/g.75214 Transcript_39244/m.75214 type:complete len:239 (+) Transcript_39244:834-1550(+)